MNNKEHFPTVNIGGTIYSPIEVEDLKEIINDVVKDALSKNTLKDTPKQFIKGIHALAKFLHISPSKAQAIKNSGKIPYSQNGRIVLFDPDKVMEAMKGNFKK